MTTQLEFEAKTSVMLRKIGADIRKALKDQTEELFNDENIAKDYKESCAKWDITITTYCSDIEMLTCLHMLIEEAFRRKINLDRCSTWRMLMRTILPPELMKKVSRLTQVPQMSMIDRTEFTKRGTQERPLFRKG